MLSSPRAQRWMYWISGLVFAAGLAAFIAVYATRSSSPAHPAHHTAAQTNAIVPTTHVKPAKSVPASPAAFKVARRFLETAVLRKDLGASYDLVGPQLKGGMTRKQWETGNIPVAFYPAENAKTTAFAVNSSHQTQMDVTVALVAKPGAKIKPLSFYLGLTRAGGKPNGRWLVNYFQAKYTPPVLAGGQ